ncbi:MULTISPECIES: MbnB/TglH/ChrH family RiPP precursor modification enzyme [Hydrogenophaga]|uniref:Uncharacterized protein n=1 Tax=Hydrogenophaga intermedia TaxID=65786 RepID=A0A1L1PCS8_HYDIT|nr:MULTISPECIES: DUF692 domain-containing protein [Hydrogenophaga]AOS80293.1 hypothetical protein Q5W_15605 [Hydrogenophaga sp. PBC]TMU77950.1 DUF692 domain-containing protein [Hydrogenophaga intermedia]CDN85803.1 hypothetical protein BN948_00198 [Hydrogenophaga intermedia]
MPAPPTNDADAPEVGIGWRAPHQRALLEQRPALDFIEVHAENFFAPNAATRAPLLKARESYGLSLHGVGLSLGSADGIDPWHLDRLATLVADTEPRFVSEHASFARGTWQARAVHAADLLPLPFTREALDVLCANVQRVQDRLRRTIAVENLSAYLAWPEADMGEVDFLVALSQRTGCQLLVDVNNLVVNALNDQRAARIDAPLPAVHRWLDAIPPDCVSELHLAGHHDRGDLVIDDHGSRVHALVWQAYRHAVARFGAVPTLIEWDTDIPALDVLLDEAASARRLGRDALRAPAMEPAA